MAKNVEQIEALLRKINEENRKTKEVLDSINKTGETNETTTKVILSKNSVISLDKKGKVVKNQKKETVKVENHGKEEVTVFCLFKAIKKLNA